MIFPVYSVHYFAFALGVPLVIAGHILRIGAEINAGSAFNHMIQYDKSKDLLVTGGLYRVCRHPSYLGWFLWCVGTQVMLGSPVCSIGFYVATLGFFRGRIE